MAKVELADFAGRNTTIVILELIIKNFMELKGNQVAILL